AILSKELAKSMIDAGVFKELILKKYYVPRDKFDLLDSGTSDSNLSEQINMQVSLKAKRGKNLGLKKSLKKFIDDSSIKAFSVPGLSDYLGDSFLVSTKIRLDGVDRVLDLSESMQIKPLYDVSDDIVRDNGGHPTYDSILKVSKSIMNDLKKLQ